MVRICEIESDDFTVTGKVIDIVAICMPDVLVDILAIELDVLDAIIISLLALLQVIDAAESIVERLTLLIVACARGGSEKARIRNHSTSLVSVFNIRAINLTEEHFTTKILLSLSPEEAIT